MRFEDVGKSRPLRQYEAVAQTSPRTVRIAGQDLVSVCSTQYLSILWSDDARNALSEYGEMSNPILWGSLGSNYLGGSHEARFEYERNIASVTGESDGLAFASGWVANYSIAQLMGLACDVILSDIRNHNSIRQGLSGFKTKVEVLDLQDCRISDSILNRCKNATVGVLVSSVDGITGESVTPQLTEMGAARVHCIIDECHSSGIVGSNGFEPFEGTKCYARTIGLSKALGTMGAVVCGPKEFTDALRQIAAPWIFSTAIPPIIWRINALLLPIAIRMSEERSRVHALATMFRNSMANTGLHVSGRHHISGVHLPRDVAADEFERKMRAAGYYIKVSQFPTRPIDDPCARVVFNPFHTEQDVREAALAIRASV